VASTKAFTTSLVDQLLLGAYLGQARGALSAEESQELAQALAELPELAGRVLTAEYNDYETLAGEFYDRKHFLYLGRGINYPIALEGALKLKEISYMHAEGYAAGEMKHGPIALIEPDMTIVVVNTPGVVDDKVRSNIEQVKARGGNVIGVGSDPRSLDLADEAIKVPSSSEWLSPVLNVIPRQLLSYGIARLRGGDIDKPRNLAKTVTVE